MRAVVQRVSRASVTVEHRVVGAIGRGLVVFLGVGRDDLEEDQDWLLRKIPQIRCFEDEDGKMNLSVEDIGGGILVISQFTLFGNLRKGTRPSFNDAGPPETAVPMYTAFCDALAARLGSDKVARGVFGAHMRIDSVNDGPVTLFLDTRNKHL